jgi:hypothetical protein
MLPAHGLGFVTIRLMPIPAAGYVQLAARDFDLESLEVNGTAIPVVWRPLALLCPTTVWSRLAASERGMPRIDFAMRVL